MKEYGRRDFFKLMAPLLACGCAAKNQKVMGPYPTYVREAGSIGIYKKDVSKIKLKVNFTGNHTEKIEWISKFANFLDEKDQIEYRIFNTTVRLGKKELVLDEKAKNRSSVPKVATNLDNGTEFIWYDYGGGGRGVFLINNSLVERELAPDHYQILMNSKTYGYEGGKIMEIRK